MRPLLLLLLIGWYPLLYGQGQSFSFSDSAILHRLKGDIYQLASDSFQGREAGTKGDSLAGAYIISRYREIGLEPKGNDSGSYLQPVPHDYSFHPLSGNYLYTDYDRYIYRREFGMTSFSASGQAEGKILMIGHGMVDGALHLDDYAGKPDPAGRVLLMEFPLPDELTKDSAILHKLTIRNRLAEAFQRGAAAVLLWNSDSPDYPGLFDFTHPDTLPGPVIFITELVTRQLKKLEGQPIHLMATISRVRKAYTNVIGFLDHQATQTVIIGAHYDHGGLNRNGVARCGADDNASGVALMLELARYLTHQEKSRYNYLFIAFGAEELGMIGSDYFCGHPVIPLEEVSFMCNFDMVGRLGAEGNRITALGTATSPQWQEVYKQMPKFPFHVKKYKGASNFSDQECFYQKQVPIFYLTTGMHPDYHTYRDRPERINYTGMVEIAKYAEEFITRAEKAGPIAFQSVSPWATILSDLNYYIKQIGHVFDVPLQDWP
ncbi:MAG: M20/M25/M40 family metallo-hydrolase [Bacteroidota bacterium]